MSSLASAPQGDRPGAAGQRVLLVKLSSLGDVIHTMPVVHDVLTHRPGTTVDWVVEPGFAPLVRRVAGIGRVIDCPLRAWRRRGLAGWFAADVREQRRNLNEALQAFAYDHVIDLQGLTKSAWIARKARLAPGGERVAMAHGTDGSGYEAPTRWLAHRAISLPRHIHAVDRGRELAARAFGYTPAQPPRYGLMPARTARQGARRMVFVHGTSRADKLWPESSWVTLGRRLVQAGWHLALPQGNDEEAARAQRLAQAIAPEQVDVWPRSDLATLLDRLAAADAVIGVDSGLSHLAVALGLPHVQIYNFPTAWRTGPQPEHGHAHQVSIEADGPPTVESVWQAWTGVARAAAAPPTTPV